MPSAESFACTRRLMRLASGGVNGMVRRVSVPSALTVMAMAPWSSGGSSPGEAYSMVPSKYSFSAGTYASA